jgi:hypothetical protein
MTIGKPEAATVVVVAPDDGRENARNMLSCFRFMDPCISDGNYE